jgi:hypothetical protein
LDECIIVAPTTPQEARAFILKLGLLREPFRLPALVGLGVPLVNRISLL